MFRLLTVGDGDLSFSLAIKRAYPQISVTASTLVKSHSELCQTYASAIETSKELQEIWNEQIIYGVDATKLEDTIHCSTEETKFDIICFNHPHLGDATLLQSEAKHAENHYALLSHYFYSAKKLIKSNGGRIHLCLCGNQPKSWKIMTAAEDNNGLQCIKQESTSVPIDKWLFNKPEEEDRYDLAEVQSHYKTKRKYRNGSLGSKHFLARYGYRHQRTEGDLFDGSVKHINVEQSINFVFEVCKEDSAKEKVEPLVEGEYTCSICKLEFDTNEELQAHLNAPGLPDIVTGAYENKKNVKSSSKEKNRPDQTNDTAKNEKKKQPIPPSSFKQSIDRDDASILVETTVSSTFDGKRIKWLCRQQGFSTFSQYIKSKSQCEEAIKKGRIFVNRQVALDSSRIVVEGDIVSLVKEYQPPKDTVHTANDDSIDNHGVKIVREIFSKYDLGNTLVVAYKPVGIRCVGSFSPNTLEMIVQKQVSSSLGITNICTHPVSKIDTGCSGLCVLAVGGVLKIDTMALNNSLKVKYTFTALVHGHPPEEWKRGVYVNVPTEGLRQWKRQKTSQKESSVETGDDVDSVSNSIIFSSIELDLDDALFIQCHDSLTVEGEQKISTLTIQSRFDDGRLSNVISYVLRKLSYPVVNDRFSKREYSALPRRMKNIIKQKVCIGCYQLDIEYEGESTIVTIDSHKRTQCSFWRKDDDKLDV